MWTVPYTHTHTPAKTTPTKQMSNNQPTAATADAADAAADDAAAAAAVLSPWRQAWNGPPIMPWSFYTAGGSVVDDAEEEDEEEAREPTATSQASTTVATDNNDASDVFAPLDGPAPPPVLFTGTLPFPSVLPPPSPPQQAAAAFDLVCVHQLSLPGVKGLPLEDLTQSANAYIARLHPSATLAEAVDLLVAIVPCLVSAALQVELGQRGMHAQLASLLILRSDGAMKWYWVGNMLFPRAVIPTIELAASALVTKPPAYLRNALDSIQALERHAKEDTLDQFIGHIPMFRRRLW